MPSLTRDTRKVCHPITHTTTRGRCRRVQRIVRPMAVQTPATLAFRIIYDRVSEEQAAILPHVQSVPPVPA